MERKTLLAITVLLFAALYTSGPAHAGPKLDFGEAAWMKIDLLAQAHYSFLDDAEDEDDFHNIYFKFDGLFIYFSKF